MQDGFTEDYTPEDLKWDLAEAQRNGEAMVYSDSGRLRIEINLDDKGRIRRDAAAFAKTCLEGFVDGSIYDVPVGLDGMEELEAA